MTNICCVFQLKSRVLMTPLAISPPRSTPEPDISSIPQDAATIPNSAAPQALTGMWNQTHQNESLVLHPMFLRKLSSLSFWEPQDSLSINLPAVFPNWCFPLFLFSVLFVPLVVHNRKKDAQKQLVYWLI